MVVLIRQNMSLPSDRMSLPWMFFHYGLCIGFSSDYIVTTKCWFANNHINLFLDGAMRVRRGLLVL